MLVSFTMKPNLLNTVFLGHASDPGVPCSFNLRISIHNSWRTPEMGLLQNKWQERFIQRMLYKED